MYSKFMVANSGGALRHRVELYQIGSWGTVCISMSNASSLIGREIVVS